MPPGQPQAPPPSDALAGEIKRGLSVERFNAYQSDANESALTTLGTYAWNVALCEAIYPVLHVCEVAVRNAVNDALRHEYENGGFGRPHRVAGATCWIDDGTVVLTREHADRVRKVKRRLKGQLGRKNQKYTPGRLVAALNFGFWVYIFDSTYGYKSPKRPGLWPRLLAKVFPHLNKAARRKEVQGRLNDIRRLRNRVFHHEPIWRLQNLNATYEEVFEVISWVSPELAKSVRRLDRFGAVHSSCTRRYLRRSLFRVSNGQPPTL